MIRQVLDHLAVRKLDSLLVEGGTQLITHFFVEAGCVGRGEGGNGPRFACIKEVHAPMLERRLLAASPDVLL